MSAMGY